MKYFHWSKFNVRYLNGDDTIVKNFLTGAVLKFQNKRLQALDNKISNTGIKESELRQGSMFFLVENGLLVDTSFDEFQNYYKDFLFVRNNDTKLFALFFLPTMNCQLACSYCVQRGVSRCKRMKNSVFEQSLKWVKSYLQIHSEITSIKFVFFGGEPLLEKKIVFNAVNQFKVIAKKFKKEFWFEVTTNGVLLDLETICFLEKNNCKVVQITLDGPQKIHDARRSQSDGTPTFQKIISNIRLLLDNSEIERVNIRLSVDEENINYIPSLIPFLAGLGNQERVLLSLGITMPSLGNPSHEFTKKTKSFAEKIVKIWELAKKNGYSIPDVFEVGPWCVAIAKHSAVIQPDGKLQKCFCFAGRSEFDFGDIKQLPRVHAKDERFEFFSRVESCIKKECPFLPICGGGCIHDSVVLQGVSGFEKTICQKSLIAHMNKGLTLLNYG